MVFSHIFDWLKRTYLPFSKLFKKNNKNVLFVKSKISDFSFYTSLLIEAIFVNGDGYDFNGHEEQ